MGQSLFYIGDNLMITNIDDLITVLNVLHGGHFDWHTRRLNTFDVHGLQFFVVFSNDWDAINKLYALIDNSLHAFLYEGGKGNCHTIHVPNGQY